MDPLERIAQFENMAKADPGNEMAHYSLGTALLEARRFREAAGAYEKCVEVAPEMSKAYQMWGDSLLKAGLREAAAVTLAKGYEVAALQGDLMPRNAIEKMLRELGMPIPEVQGAAAPGASGANASAGIGGGFVCKLTGKPGTKMPKPPFRGPIGKWIHANIAAETFQQWIGQGTKVINELRLDLSREEDAETYDRYMREYLGIDQALYEQLRSGGEARESDR